MQTWKPKVAESKEAAVASNLRYYEVPKSKGGIEFTRNGATFTELRMIQDKGSDSIMFLAELSDGKGGKTYDVMSPKNWETMGLNCDPISAFGKHLRDSVKQRSEAVKAACLETAKKYHGAGLSMVALKASLKVEGFNEADVELAVAEVSKETKQ